MNKAGICSGETRRSVLGHSFQAMLGWLNQEEEVISLGLLTDVHSRIRSPPSGGSAHHLC